MSHKSRLFGVFVWCLVWFLVLKAILKTFYVLPSMFPNPCFEHLEHDLLHKNRFPHNSRGSFPGFFGDDLLHSRQDPTSNVVLTTMNHRISTNKKPTVTFPHYKLFDPLKPLSHCCQQLLPQKKTTKQKVSTFTLQKENCPTCLSDCCFFHHFPTQQRVQQRVRFGSPQLALGSALGGALRHRLIGGDWTRCWAF